METFIALVQKHFNGDTMATARAVLRLLRVPKAAATVLLPVVANGVRLIVRGENRATERSYYAHANDESVETPTGTGPERRRAFLEGRFALADGTSVVMGLATVAQHRLRVELLEKMRGGIDTTIAQHLAAIDQITTAGVTCLNDIEAASPPPLPTKPRARASASATAAP